MKNKNTQKLTLAAMVAAAYAVLSLLGAVFGITYGPIQVRFSEALCLLPFLFPETAWGLGVGCLIANLFSPYGVLDIVVGSLATLIAALITSRCRNVWLGALPPVACNMVLVGAVLAYEQAGTSAAFWPAYGLNAATVGAGEAIACLVLGVLLVKQLPRIPYFRDRSNPDKQNKQTGRPHGRPVFDGVSQVLSRLMGRRCSRARRSLPLKGIRG